MLKHRDFSLPSLPIAQSLPESPAIRGVFAGKQSSLRSGKTNNSVNMAEYRNDLVKVFEEPKLSRFQKNQQLLFKL